MHHPPPHPRLVLFPGLAAGARMFEPQRRAFPGLESPLLPDPVWDETLTQYAQRVAKLIAPDPPPFVGGVSFGAALALEIARHLPTRGVFLIGGMTDAQQISLPFRLLLHAARFVPNFGVPPMLAFFPVGLDMLESLHARHRDLYSYMARTTEPQTIRWGAIRLVEWSWQNDRHIPVHQIHGGNDFVIPVRNVRPDVVVPRGRHLINLTHPRMVNAFLRERMGCPRARALRSAASRRLSS